MNRTAVFSKTGKGLLEIKNKANRLSKDQYRVLNLVDGKATLLDLADRAKVTEIELRKVLTALSDGGYIKEFTNPAGELGGTTAPPSASYADDLDFTTILGPSQPSKPGFYQSAALEQRQRESAERKASEAAATKARVEQEQRAREQAQRKALAEEAARKVREEAERRAREEHDRQERLVADMRTKVDTERKVKEDAERRAREIREAAERKIAEERAEAERRAKEEADRRARIQTEARARVEAEKRAREEEEERKRKEEEERKRREEEERKRQEEEERRRKEEEERKRREEEERKRREEEERRRREEEERKRREEEERKRREEEERRRKEEEERKRREEEERKRREEEERRRREEEERKRREEEERRRREEEERKRKEEEERRRKEEVERLKRELEEKHRREAEELERRLTEGHLHAEGGGSDEDDRHAREDLERRQREEEARRQREQEEERRRRDEDEARRRREEDERRRREEEERRRKADEERRQREEEEHKRREAELEIEPGLPSLDLISAPAPAANVGIDPDLDALRRAEAEVEREFVAKEDAIRKALEEQERRFRMEEEARTAMDRAEREERERADREARELALTAERARKEAEQRSREESVRRAEEDRERRLREQEEKKKQAEEERRKRERERREAEQRAREEELTRRRHEQEERDRRKAEIDRIAREQRKITLGPGKIAAIAVVVLFVLAVVVIEVAPMSAYAPDIEKRVSEAIGEPVRIGAVHASMFPSFHLRLDDITVGNAQDIKADKAIVYMGIGGMFGDPKEVSKLVLDGVSAPADALARVPGWLGTTGPAATSLQVARVQIDSIKLDAKGIQVPAFKAEILLTPERDIKAITLETTDNHIDVELTPREGGMDIVARGREFTLPLGPSFEITDFSGKAVVTGRELRVTELEYSLYSGHGKGTAVLSWANGWSLEGDFDVERIDLEPAMRALQADIPSDGTLEAKGRYATQSAALDTLFSAPRVDASFVVRKGNLSGLDLVRALQTPTRETAGGKTKFDDMIGNFSAAGDRYQFNGVRLQAGLLTATGQLDIGSDRDANGRAYVELRSTASTVKGSFRITGTAKGMTLKP